MVIGPLLRFAPRLIHDALPSLEWTARLLLPQVILSQLTFHSCLMLGFYRLLAATLRHLLHSLLLTLVVSTFRNLQVRLLDYLLWRDLCSPHCSPSYFLSPCNNVSPAFLDYIGDCHFHFNFSFNLTIAYPSISSISSWFSSPVNTHLSFRLVLFIYPQPQSFLLRLPSTLASRHISHRPHTPIQSLTSPLGRTGISCWLLSLACYIRVQVRSVCIIWHMRCPPRSYISTNQDIGAGYTGVMRCYQFAACSCEGYYGARSCSSTATMSKGLSSRDQTLNHHPFQSERHHVSPQYSNLLCKQEILETQILFLLAFSHGIYKLSLQKEMIWNAR